MKRIFLALRAKLYDYDKIQSDFFEAIEGRWIPSENIHITVSFFGDRFGIDELIEKLPSLIVPVEPLKLNSLGYFKSNRILYAATQSRTLESLNTLIGDSFSIKQSKNFIPHATIMRIKKIKNEELFKEILGAYKNKEVGTLESTLQLMQSHIRHPGGAEYECIKRFES